MSADSQPAAGGGPNLVPLIAGAAVVVGILGGVGIALLGGAGDSGPLTTQGEAPKVPEGAPPPPIAPPPADDAPAEPQAVAFALKMAQRLEGAEEEAAALAVLDDCIRDHGSSPALVALRNGIYARCDALLAKEAEKIGGLAKLGQQDLIVDKIEGLRIRMPAAFHPELDMLARAAAGGAGAEAEPAEPAPAALSQAEPEAPPEETEAEAQSPHAKTFALLLRNLADSDSAQAHFELGQWAAERELARRAHERFQRAIELDAFHEGARQALGHTFHEGRWYTEDEYKGKVLGLVKDETGEWVKPEALAGATQEKKPKQPATPKPKPGVFVPPPPPSPHAEDKDWYKDGKKVCDWGDSPAYKSKYYLIKTNLDEAYAERYGKMMDRYFKRFVKVFEAFLPNKRYEKSEIWIHASKAEFHAETGMPQSVGGFYNTQTKRVTAYHGLFGQQGTTRDVLAHEGTHQFQDLVLQGKFRNAPIWIIEGLAVLFESAYYDGEDVRIGLIPRDRLYALKRGLASGTLIPLRNLIRTSQRSFTGYHYAHAWSLIYMVLYYGKSAKVRKRCQKWFSDLFAAALDGPVSAAQVEESMGGRQAFRELEDKWKEWLKDLPYDYDPKRIR